ncbi:MAG: hypothetical protein HYY83_14090, partial [Deltaproteobacteria bacterium]|nr:hypothetical protein [Deltaproteobacteria bacterium]
MSTLSGLITALLLFIVLPIGILLIRDLISLAMGKPRRFDFSLGDPAERKAIKNYFEQLQVDKVKAQKFSSPGFVKLYATLWTLAWSSFFLLVCLLVPLLAIDEMSGGGFGELIERDYGDLAVRILWTPFVILGLAILVSLFIVCDNCGYRCFAIVINMTLGSAVYIEHTR